MMMRLGIALLIASASSVQAALPVWTTTVQPEKPGLPAIRIELGYPGEYVPAINSPIVITATAADVPFHGYIGYHFAAKGLQTRDTPVVFPMQLLSHGTGSVRSFANVSQWGVVAENGKLPRELAIQWRDRDMRVIATQSAGVPPWTTFGDQPRALTITADTAEASVLGRKAYVAAPAALSDRAQWYAGFSSVVAPLDIWIDVPLRVREAVFSSGVYIVLSGFPRAGQSLDALNAAILPVVFKPSPGSYEVPWPYGQSRPVIPSPVSWTAKNGVASLGPAANPYIVRSAVATWIADDRALTRPLPAIERVASMAPINFYTFPNQRLDRVMLSAAGAALLVSFVAWPIARRKPAWITAVALLVISVAIVLARPGLRVPSAYQRTLRTPVAPGIANRFEVLFANGPTPIAEIVAAPENARMMLTGDFGLREDAEVRTSGAAPSMGLLYRRYDWDTSARWRFRREHDGSVGTNDRIVDASIRDFHGSITFWSRQRGTADDFKIECRLGPALNGQMNCLAGLPANVAHGHTAVIELANGMPDTAELSWATGTRQFSVTQSDIYHPKTWTIPDDVLREIAANGGTFNVAMAPQQQMFEVRRIWIRVQEKKS
jgi:hypothetical protein